MYNIKHVVGTKRSGVKTSFLFKHLKNVLPRVFVNARRVYDENEKLSYR